MPPAKLTVNPPAKHHFIPEFYLREWTGSDGELERFWRTDRGNIEVLRQSPAAFGWQRHLYRAPGVEDPWKAQTLETHFFAPLDAAAAVCMARLARGDIHNWSGDERTAWTMFLLSLFHRQPEHLEATAARLRDIFVEQAPAVQARYEELKGPDDPASYEEWERTHAPQLVERSVYRLIPGVIDNEKIGGHIINIRWGVIDVGASDHPLLISDNPIIFRPLKLDHGHIALPIAPTKLFMASGDERLWQHVGRTSPKQLVRSANATVVGNACTFVGAIDRGSEAYIRKHYGTRRLGSLATGYKRS